MTALRKRHSSYETHSNHSCCGSLDARVSLILATAAFICYRRLHPGRSSLVELCVTLHFLMQGRKANKHLPVALSKSTATGRLQSLVQAGLWLMNTSTSRLFLATETAHFSKRFSTVLHHWATIKLLSKWYFHARDLTGRAGLAPTQRTGQIPWHPGISQWGSCSTAPGPRSRGL